MKARLAGADANDFLYAVEASRDYDPSGALEKIEARVLAINSADDQVNPPELDLMEKLMPRVRGGRFVLLPIGPETRRHGTHSYPAGWQGYLKEFLEHLPPLPMLGAPRARPRSQVVASASGGLGRPDSRGGTWTPLFDAEPTLTIGAFALGDADGKVLYVGTGEANSSRTSYAGIGMSKSIDGGKHW